SVVLLITIDMHDARSGQSMTLSMMTGSITLLLVGSTYSMSGARDTAALTPVTNAIARWVTPDRWLPITAGHLPIPTQMPPPPTMLLPSIKVPVFSKMKYLPLPGGAQPPDIAAIP